MSYKRTVLSLIAVNIILLIAWSFFQAKSGTAIEMRAIALLLAGVSAAGIALVKWKNKNGYALSAALACALVFVNISGMFSVGSLTCCQLETGSIAFAGFIVNIALAPFAWTSFKESA